MMDDLRDTFFAESEDLLTAMGEGLAAMSDGSAGSETVHAVFRAVHSIKGAAGAFALSDVVAFAHSFETVLDAVRSDRLVPDPDVMRVLQRAGDVLAELLEHAREDRSDPPSALGSVLDALEEITGGQDDATPDDFVFEPLGLGMMAPLALPPAEATGFHLDFRPTGNFYPNGHHHQHLFAALSELGELTVTCSVPDLPPSAETDAEGNQLSWKLELRTDADEVQVRDVFEFVEGLCELELRKVESLDSFDDRPPHDDSTLPEVAMPTLAQAPDPEVLPRPLDVSSAVPTPAAARESAPRPTLRVDLDRVDRLINSVGELIINQAVIAQKVSEAGLPPASSLVAHVEDLSLLAREIQEGVMLIRAQPVKALFQRMARVVREAAEATGKQVELVTEGEETEVDRTVVEGLADPLTHMVRNAIDHGIEPPSERIATGKPACGRITLSASHVSGNVRIVVRDDGAGLNRDRIHATALRKGLVAADAVLTEAEIDNLLFLPGFSTAASITSLSGRGVGMDVARTAITALGGRIGILSTPGEGTTFNIILPLTLAILEGLIVTVAGQPMVVPAASVIETIRPAPRDFIALGHADRVLAVRGDHVPVIDVPSLLGFGPELDPMDAIVVLVRASDDSLAALVMEAISDKRQVVIKSLRSNVGQVAGTSAATILGDGKVALILDPDALTALAARRRAAQHAVQHLASREVRHEHAA
ncbi:chemotaxis protein CheA [Rubellimicrobium arenae]|uniref:chemotaxis protein CheA n=1 Tax=Rubellimicrobium arenae TaxID=2817372 RepID=UPI001FF0096F|nr:chemotaxis protein CheA [Rubellimicrobium arenae]